MASPTACQSSHWGELRRGLSLTDTSEHWHTASEGVTSSCGLSSPLYPNPRPDCPGWQLSPVTMVMAATALLCSHVACDHCGCISLALHTGMTSLVSLIELELNSSVYSTPQPIPGHTHQRPMSLSCVTREPVDSLNSLLLPVGFHSLNPQVRLV